MGLVGRGLSNDEIADELYLSPLTVKTHVSRAMTKLHARDQAQLVAFAFRTGLATLDDLSSPRSTRVPERTEPPPGLLSCERR